MRRIQISFIACTLPSLCSETFETFQNPMQDYFEKHLVHFSKMCVVQPHGLVMPPRYPTYHSKHLSYPCKESDIWVATFAKCGTTWTQELVWCLIKGMDDPNGKKPLMERFPFFEWALIIYGGIIHSGIHIFFYIQQILVSSNFLTQ